MKEVEVFKNQVALINQNIPRATPVIGSINYESLIDYQKKVESITNQISLMKVDYNTIDDFKKLGTELNKAANDIDTQRKDIEKQFNAPLNDYKLIVKDLVTKIKDAREHIKKGIDVFDEEERTEKRNEFIECWKTFGKAEKIPFELIEKHQFIGIENNKWYNKSVSKKSVMIDLAKINDIINNDIKSIKLFVESEKEQLAIFDNYCQSLDLQKEITEYKKWKKSIDNVEIVEVVAEEEKPTIQVKSVEDDDVITTLENDKKPLESNFNTENKEIKQQQVMIAFKANSSFVDSLENLFKQNNIKYNIHRNNIKGD